MTFTTTKFGFYFPNILLLIYFFNPFNFGFIFGYLLFIYLLINFKILNLTFNKEVFILTVFSILYALFYSFNPHLGTQYLLIFSILPLTGYLVGRLNGELNITASARIILIFGIIFSIPNIISVFISIYENGFVSLERDVINIWSGEKEPATNMAGKMVMNMVVPSVFLLKSNIFKSKLFITIAVLFFSLSLTCILRLGSRTHIVIGIFTLIFTIFYRLRKQSATKNLIFLIVVFIVANFVFSYLSIDSDNDVLSAYADRMDSKKYGAATAGGRTQKWEKAAELIFTKPIGWDLSEIGLAHNLWFDVARVGGIITLLFLILYTSGIIKRITTVTVSKNSSFYNFGLFPIYLIGFLLLFAVEPIMDGYFPCFVMFCFVGGIFSRQYNQLVDNL